MNASERRALQACARADAIVALAFEHHLAIARNILLEKFVDWLVGLASCGLIELVQKADPTIQRMLALGEDVFRDYQEESFFNGLGQRILDRSAAVLV